MRIKLFEHIMKEVTKFDRFFEQKRNCIRELGHSTIQKVMMALCIMACGATADLVYDHLAMDESQAIKCVKHLAIVRMFGEKYLRAPNTQYATRLQAFNKAHVFPCIGSIDCMY
jgi:hypothetical protein